VKALFDRLQAISQNLFDGDMRERDATMTARVQQAMDELQNVETLLVQVGKQHVPGISTRLTSMGWKREVQSQSADSDEHTHDS
jgi:hypothetical protein